MSLRKGNTLISGTGKNGLNGHDGQDGFSPIATVTKSGSTSTLTVTDANGTTSTQILDGQTIQYSTMPTASSSNVGNIIQYVGTTTNDYTNGYFYKCVDNSGTYSWENAEVQNAGGSLPTVDFYDLDPTVYDLLTECSDNGISSIIVNAENFGESGYYSGVVCLYITSETSADCYYHDYDGYNCVSFSLETDPETGDMYSVYGAVNNIQPQYYSLPTADAEYEGKIVQYIGATDNTYTNGYFYKCVDNSGTYSWENINVQAGSGGGQTIQYDTMPTPSSTNEGDIVQFVGTTGTYTNGWFYKCVSDGQSTPTYSWEQLNTQPRKYSIEGDYIIYNISAGAYGINVTSATSQTTVNLPQAEVNEAITLAINNNKKLCLYVCDISNIHSVLFMGSTIPPTSGTTLELLGRFTQGSGNTWIATLKLTYTYTNSTVATTSKKITGRTLYSLGTINENTFEPNYDSYNPATAKYAEQMTLPVAPKYSKTTAYAVGDYVTQYNELYVCNTAIPSGENWNSSHWTKTNVVSIIGNINTALASLVSVGGNQ